MVYFCCLANPRKSEGPGLKQMGRRSSRRDNSYMLLHKSKSNYFSKSNMKGHLNHQLLKDISEQMFKGHSKQPTQKDISKSEFNGNKQLGQLNFKGYSPKNTYKDIS